MYNLKFKMQNYNSKGRIKILNSKFLILNSQGGQAIIMLLFFVIVSIILTSGAVIVSFVNLQSTSKQEQGTLAYSIAESGAENALLRLLRDPSYNSETVAIDTGTAAITVATSGNTRTVVSTGTAGNFKRKIQVVVDYTNNVLTILSWKEIP